MKTLPEYITLLHSYMQQNASKYGILRMGIFGSVARNEHTPTSDVDIYVEPGSSFEIGIFSARVILSYYDQLLEGAEKIWTPFGVRPLLWKIEEDHASFWETAIPEEKRLTEDFPLCIEPGRYHHDRAQKLSLIHISEPTRH